ncbi:hypothetical protein EVAR_51926_1 [Eumeta japonica]|uniref:Uncharacterized protein n=1 Tax=Eumeta variegata TaxID=151549 RepID=A0A4C1XHW1_EUMVA|nr:hypothetical protein EVAR_51926_1 [Eumeta japonica]
MCNTLRKYLVRTKRQCEAMVVLNNGAPYSARLSFSDAHRTDQIPHCVSASVFVADTMATSVLQREDCRRGREPETEMPEGGPRLTDDERVRLLEKGERETGDLPSELREAARLELREEDSLKEHSLAQMRHFIEKHPAIKKCRTEPSGRVPGLTACAVMAGTSDKYFTMQGSGNPVSASGQGEKAGPQASSSSDCSSSVVGNLATGESVKPQKTVIDDETEALEEMEVEKEEVPMEEEDEEEEEEILGDENPKNKDFMPDKKTKDPETFSREELNDLIRDLNLPKDGAELLASRLKHKNLLAP